MERMYKLYDGDYWYCVKGKGKRVGIPSARMGMVTFTTPRRFLTEIWPKMISCRNGLVDRILIWYQENQDRDIEVMEENCTLLKECAVKSLGTVYEKLYNDHHQEHPVEYLLSASARERYYKYCKQKSSGAEAAGGFSPECNAKAGKNAIRLALALHVLWHRLGAALDRLAGPTPQVISNTTMGYALTLHDTMLQFGGIAEASLQLKKGASIRMSISEQDVKHRILTTPGPYSNCKRIYSHFSSTARPSPQKVEEYMSDLKAAQLGTIKKVGRMTVFYKELPSVLQHREHELGNFNIAINEYKGQFLASDDLLTSLQKQSMLGNHPQTNDVKTKMLT
ncbi:uncharacterized protein LOC116619405 isoform X2 [Nematostella vectensis]|nr:uncharacterized protein LOC116619405 isoform X2 [Nematostella vectensis]